MLVFQLMGEKQDKFRPEPDVVYLRKTGSDRGEQGDGFDFSQHPALRLASIWRERTMILRRIRAIREKK